MVHLHMSWSILLIVLMVLDMSLKGCGWCQGKCEGTTSLDRSAGTSSARASPLGSLVLSHFHIMLFRIDADNISIWRMGKDIIWSIVQSISSWLLMTYLCPFNKNIYLKHSSWIVIWFNINSPRVLSGAQECFYTHVSHVLIWFSFHTVCWSILLVVSMMLDRSLKGCGWCQGKREGTTSLDLRAATGSTWWLLVLPFGASSARASPQGSSVPSTLH
jgi:hypothetical protein